MCREHAPTGEQEVHTGRRLFIFLFFYLRREAAARATYAEGYGGHGQGHGQGGHGMDAKGILIMAYY